MVKPKPITVVNASEIMNSAIAPITLPAWTRSTVQPIGLPAMSSLTRIRSGASAPDIRLASLEALCWNGPMIRSENDSSYSLASSVGAPVRACTRATERSTPVTAWPPAEVDAAAETRNSATTTSAPPRIRRMVMSHLDLDDARHPEDADGQDRRAADQHQDAQRSGEEHHHVGVVGEHQVEQEGRRKPAEDHRRELALGGQRGDLTAHVLALAHGGRHRVQQLGEVASDLALDVDGHHDPVEVLALEPVGDALEGGLERQPETGLDEHLAELAGDRLGGLADDGVDRLRQRQTGSQGPGHQLQGVGERRLELLLAALATEAEVQPGSEPAQRHEQQPDDQVAAADEQADDRDPDEDRGVEEQPLGRAPVAAARLETVGDLLLERGVALEDVRGGGLGRLQRRALGAGGRYGDRATADHAGGGACGVLRDPLLGGQRPLVRHRHQREDQQ